MPYNNNSWFRSYLTRFQMVRYDDKLSDELPTQTCIGQGTILGPLLFILYIKGIVNAKGTLKINMYADDCIFLIWK